MVSKTPFVIRPAGREDLDLLVEFNAAMARETEDKSLDLGRLRAGVALVLNADDKGFYLVAELAGRVVFLKLLQLLPAPLKHLSGPGQRFFLARQVSQRLGQLALLLFKML